MFQPAKRYFKNYLRIFLFPVIIMAACNKSPGFLKKEKPEEVIGANNSRLQSSTIHLSKDTVYILTTNLTRDAGQVLSIEAGTLIKVNDKLSITINPGAKIEAKGTATEPVVFTSSAYRGGAGSPTSRYWYGISIYGNFLTGQGSSGTLNYTRIEFAGGDNDTGMPSLMLNNVTKETSLQNVQVSYSYKTSSFGFYGGDVNASNLVSYASTGTDFYICEGYKGRLQNLLAWRHPYFPANIDRPAPSSPVDALAGLFIEGPETLPVISNVTVIGPDLRKGMGYYYTNEVSVSARVAAVVTTGGSKFHIRNSVFLGFPKVGWYLGDAATAIALNKEESDFTYSIVHSNDATRSFYLPEHVYPPYTSDDFKSYVLQPQFGNELFFNSAEFELGDPFNYDSNPNALPRAGSPLLVGADFNSPVFDDPFFERVSYRGALGTNNWLSEWTNFNPLRTNYNN